MSNEQKKIATFIIGAGFSYALAGFKLTKIFSEELLKELDDKLGNKFNDDSNKKIFWNWFLKFNRPDTKLWDFEVMADLLRCIGTLSKYSYPNLPFENNIDEIFPESVWFIHDCSDYFISVVQKK